MDTGESLDDKVVDFLLPSGILIPLPCGALQSLDAIKDKLWKEAQAFPLFGLKGPEWYTLVFVNLKAEQEECHDEAQRLCDVQMYKPLFKVQLFVTNVCITILVLSGCGKKRQPR